MLTANVPPGVKADELAALCGGSIRTARRWLANGYMPSGLAIGFKLLKDGDLGNLHKAWRGWRLVGDKIYSPDGWDFRPGENRRNPVAGPADQGATRRAPTARTMPTAARLSCIRSDLT